MQQQLHSTYNTIKSFNIILQLPLSESPCTFFFLHTLKLNLRLSITRYVLCANFLCFTERSPSMPMSTAGSAARARWCPTETEIAGTVPTVSSTMVFKRYGENTLKTHCDGPCFLKPILGLWFTEELQRSKANGDRH